MTPPAATWLFPGGLAAALVLDHLAGDTALLLALGLGVAVLGLPHGGLDPEVARRRLGVNGLHGWTAFTLSYFGLAAAVLLLWWRWPVFALSAFLLYSAWHFGEDTGRRIGRAGALGYGLLVVFLPLALQPVDSARILMLLSPTGPGPLLGLAGWLCAAGVAMLLSGLLRARSPAITDWRDPALLLLGAWLLPPLAYFIAYFCFLHSPRHLLETAEGLGLHDWRSWLRAVAPATLATWCMAAAAVPWLLSSPPEALVLRIVFIGLAALTVPHMLLNSFAARWRGPEQPSQSASLNASR